MSTLVKNISLFFTFQKTPLVDRCCFSHSDPFNAFILLRGCLDWKIITQWVKFSPWLHCCKPGVKSWKQREFFSICISLHKSRWFFWAGTKPVLTLCVKSSPFWFLENFFLFRGLRNIYFLLQDKREFCSQSETRSFFRYELENNKVVCVVLLTYSHAILDLLDIWIAWALFGGQGKTQMSEWWPFASTRWLPLDFKMEQSAWWETKHWSSGPRDEIWKSYHWITKCSCSPLPPPFFWLVWFGFCFLILVPFLMQSALLSASVLVLNENPTTSLRSVYIYIFIYIPLKKVLTKITPVF